MVRYVSRSLNGLFGSSVLGALVPIGAVFLLALALIGYIWTSSESHQIAEEHQQFAADYLQNQKEVLRAEVVRVKQFLLREKAHAEQALEAELTRRVDEATRIVQGIYDQYHQSHSEAEVRDMMVAALSQVRFNQGRGYFFINSLEEVNYLYPPNPQVQGQHIDQVFSPAERAVIRQVNALATVQGAGFMHYPWIRPGSGGQVYQKYSYVKLFKPYGLVIGTGDYLEDFEALIRERIYRQIAETTFGLNNEGYFFINSYTGDLYVTNGQYFGGQKNIWEATDARGTKVVQENARLARNNPDGAFSTYIWRKNSGEEAEKLSFILGMDEWQIFIGAGAYLDTIEEVIAARQQQYEELALHRNISSLLVLVLAILVVIVVLYAIGVRISENLRLFQHNLERSVDTWTKLDTERLHFDEFKQLAVSVNYMIDGLNQQAEEMRHRAFHDHLTSLPNRLHSANQLDQMIARAIEYKAQAALLFIDLDHFKEINDTLGHSAGDELLQQVSQRLRAAIREGDIVARLGGDEFTVITGLLSHHKDAELIAKKIQRVFQNPFQVDGHELHVTASIGVSLFPEDGDNAELLLRNADSAMYEAKRGGRNSFRFYTPAMTAAVSERFTMTDELREAIDKQQFELYYQPQIDLESGKINGAEALIRWRHPQKGLVPPGTFIPYAESSGQIIRIGRWVLEQVCRTLVDWQTQGYPVVRVALNVSSQQMDLSLLSQIKTVLEQTGCPPHLLELEITESALMEAPELMSDALNQLRESGVSLAIDDFGTGYSSLSYLKQLPIDKLKVDRSFIRDLDEDEQDRTLTSAIIAMANSLDLKVVAEGVEHESQLTFLLEQKCGSVQGYFFSKPLPEQDFLEFLSNHQ